MAKSLYLALAVIPPFIAWSSAYAVMAHFEQPISEGMFDCVGLQTFVSLALAISILATKRRGEFLAVIVAAHLGLSLFLVTASLLFQVIMLHPMR